VKLFSVSIVYFLGSNYIKFVDADLYLEGYYLNDKSIRIQMVQVLAWFFGNTIGSFFTYFLFSLISTIGIIYYYVLGGKRWEILLFLFLPSVFIWTSVIGKESIFYGFFTLSIVILSKYVNGNLKVYDFIFLAISIVICMLLRPHYAVILLWFMVSISALKKWGFRGSYRFLLVFSITIIGLIYFNVWEEILFRGFTAIDPTARYSRYDYFQIQPNAGNGSLEPGFIRFKELLFLGWIVGIIGPMPFEVFARPVLIIFMIEGFLILVSPAIFFYIAYRLIIKRKNLFFYIFFLSLIPSYFYLIWIHAPFGLLNFGSAIRWRINFETAFYLFPFLLMLDFIYEKEA
jgi:hypothetical protein